LYWDLFSPIDAIEIVEQNIGSSANNDLHDARNSFSELGAQLIAFDKSESFAAWLARKMGFDAMQAGRALRSISIELGTLQEDRETNFLKVDQALKFRIDKSKKFYNPRN